MTNNAKNFLQKNLYQILVGVIVMGTNLFAFYISFQLFQQSTNFRVAAISTDVLDIKQSIKELTNINTNVTELNGKIDVINAKLDSIVDRQDRQGDAIVNLKGNSS